MNVTKYLVEFIGTFFLVATIGFTVLKPGDAGNLALPRDRFRTHGDDLSRAGNISGDITIPR